MRVLDALLAIFADYWGEKVASKAARALIYSIVCNFLQARDAAFRWRLNVLLNFPPGWGKSHMLFLMQELLTRTSAGELLRCVDISAATMAALRGTVNEGIFIPPEYALADIIIISELSSLMDFTNEAMGQLLTLLEEGRVRVALAKNALINDEGLELARELGISFDHRSKRFSYATRAATWCATHSLEVIPQRFQDAFFSRFLVVQMGPEEMPRERVAQALPRIDSARKARVMAAFIARARAGEIDEDFTNEVLEYIVAHSRADVEINFRIAGDIRRIAAAHHVLVPEDSVPQVAKIVNQYLGIITLNLRDQIVEFIDGQARTFAEIQAATRASKGAIYNVLNRIKAKRLAPLRKGQKTRYYLGDLAE